MPTFLLRHCHATGQAPDAALSDRGQAQAAALAGALVRFSFTTFVASPWLRAVASVTPLAAARGLPIRQDERLTEYVLAPAPRDDWREQLRRNYAEPSRMLPGGESIAGAAARIRAVVQENDGGLVVTHGGLLASYLEILAPGTGFAAWERMGNPALFVVEADVAREVAI